MSWVKMDDRWPSNRKLRRVEPLDRLLWVMAIAYVSEQNSDGRLDGGMLEYVAFLAGVTKPYEAAERLTAVGLFDLDAGGWVIHDYLAFNYSAEQRADISAMRAEVGRLGGLRKASNRANSQAHNPLANGLANPKQKSGRPVPSRPVLKSSSVSQSSGPSHEHDDEPAVPTDGRTDDVLKLLGRADHERAVREGVKIRNPVRHLEACVDARLRGDRQPVADALAEHPDWDPARIARHMTDPRAEKRARVNQALGADRGPR